MDQFESDNVGQFQSDKMGQAKSESFDQCDRILQNTPFLNECLSPEDFAVRCCTFVPDIEPACIR
jgi:hypothetical protein